jgi:hypothetical protein
MGKKEIIVFFFMRTNQEHLNTECGRSSNALTDISTDAIVYSSLMCAILDKTQK